MHETLVAFANEIDDCNEFDCLFLVGYVRPEFTLHGQNTYVPDLSEYRNGVE